MAQPVAQHDDVGLPPVMPVGPCNCRCIRQRRGLAHRLPAGDAGPGGASHERAGWSAL